jgi:hypothetical protein
VDQLLLRRAIAIPTPVSTGFTYRYTQFNTG